MRSAAQALAFTLNGNAVQLHVAPGRRLSAVLREDLGLTGTKVGCNAGDCGACTVLLDGRQACACLVPAARAAGRRVTTVEGLAEEGAPNALQASFLRHGAAQCGICTPGMLMAATDLLARVPHPSADQVEAALGGVLCRCTGYRMIIDAVMDASMTPGSRPEAPGPVAGAAVGARMGKVDGLAKVTGAERFGADALPEEGCLEARAIRSPHPHARFTLGDMGPLLAAHPGLVRVLTAADVPGRNLYGIYPTGKDQPVLAEGYVRHRGEAVCALVGEADALAAIPDGAVPIVWDVLPPVGFMEEAPELHAHAPGNVLCHGRVACGVPRPAAAEAGIETETAFVEHAYIEPEAGYARRVGDRIEIVACTQTPYMDRDELAPILGIRPDQVRVVPTAVGGGFGGKLDLSLQPIACIAAWLLGRPVRMEYSRTESMASTTKRHPARIAARLSADAEGRLVAMRFHGDFDTGAYASWGPTVANRVPVHASGPYRLPHLVATTTAWHTTGPSAGAFRGFGVPQAALATEALMDDLAEALGQDRLAFRRLNALRPGDATTTGQVLGVGAALVECLDALAPHWARMLAAAEAANAAPGPMRHGVGVACMWYGIGNTSMSNPSEMVMGIDQAGRDGQVRAVLFSGAVDIGQGSNTVMVQIAADALGVAAGEVALVAGDTDLTRDAGKTSASRQTLVSGNAARAAGLALRAAVLRQANAGEDAVIRLGNGVCVEHDGLVTRLELGAPGADGLVLRGEGRYDPPTTALDADGQGVPYAAYAFAAQLAAVAVDTGLGTVKVTEIVAAHDVGRAINPLLVEGQIHGGIAQGLGLALMEEYVPGRTENLHDYLVPTMGDVPPITTILVEAGDAHGPHGAKGVGEPALIATAPAILGAIRHATGARLTRVPATPARVLAALT